MESHVNDRKQNPLSDSCEKQRLRKSDIRTELLRVVGGLPARSFLSRRNPWDEVSRGELPYEPFEKGLLMIRDVARTAHQRLRKEKQDDVRARIHAFFATLERYALEELPEQLDGDVVPLLLEETKIEATADEAQDLAKVAQTRENLLAVARTADAQVRVGTRLRDACYRAADAGLKLVRQSPVRQLT
jgi:hypothetical protein